MAQELKVASPLTNLGGHVDMGKRRNPPTQHAEGQHGPRTHSRFVEQLHETPPAEPLEETLARRRKRAGLEGKRRLVEDRQQHDEGEKNSERKRFAKEYKHGRTEDGPSDNKGNLHGVLGHRSNRADYKLRGPNGLPVKKRSR
jgi:hypothetical protein